MLHTDPHNHALQTALSEEPSLSLNFYTYGVTLKKREGDRFSEFPIDPAQAAVALAAELSFDTGLLGNETLLVRQRGIQRTVVEYRKAQLTGIYLEGTETALRVPLPPLIMMRVTRDNRAPEYAVYAVKKRPTTLDCQLFHAPLPNIFASGNICWGTVQRVSDDALHGTSLTPDFQQLLGSRFGDHACGGKSRTHPQDIRKKFIQLEVSNAKRYPTSDLIPARKTLAQLLGDAS